MMPEPVKIDIIILSYAKTASLKTTTLNAVKSLFASENTSEICFEVLVIESYKNLAPYQYPGTKTIYPDAEFGYNRYLNIGISQTSNKYVCLCNNDLIFHSGWARKILDVFDAQPYLQSANPYCDGFVYDKFITTSPDDVILRDKNINITSLLTGWCIFVKRSVFETIGLLDEQFEFWYADTDYDLTLQKYKIGHALIKTSRVSHIGCVSHIALEDKTDDMTTGQRQKFEDKWHRKPLIKQLFALFINSLKGLLNKNK